MIKKITFTLALFLLLSGCQYTPQPLPYVEESEPTTISEYINTEDTPTASDTISNYYYFIANGVNRTPLTAEEKSKMQTKAYALLTDNNKPPLAEFLKNHADIDYIRHLKETELPNGTFNITLEYFNRTKPAEIHQQTVKVKNGKVQILSDASLPLPYTTETLLLPNGQTATIQITQNNDRTLSINNTIVEKISKLDEFYAATLNISNLQILSNPNYLSFTNFGWEQSKTKIIDLNTNKIVLAIDSPEILEFTSADNMLVTCLSPGMHDSYFKVYNIPSFTEKPNYSLVTLNNLIQCLSFNRETNTLTYKFNPTPENYDESAFKTATLTIQ